MGTKANPGKYDCYAKAEPDEPMFILLGRDKRASYLVKLWAELETNDIFGALDTFNEMVRCTNVDHFVSEKGIEAHNCSEAMQEYYNAKHST